MTRHGISLLIMHLVTGLAVLPAVGAAADPPASVADYDAFVTASDREHWSFQPVRKPNVPEVKDKSWVRNPIDAFILARLEAQGWQPAVAAEPHQLLRRMYLDVIGLPPTPTELEKFLKEPTSAALDQAADDLLSRLGYGERWGRHWLDLVRYAETNGYERDGAKPSVWRYRDYVIRSFNDDKPFDRFILEQLAGDELEDSSSDTVTALGYYRLGPWDDEPADPLEDRFDQLDDIVSTTSQVFLGLTLGCARCHNHKFEPLSQLDYYRLLAVFDPLQRFQNGRSDLDAPAGNLSQLAAQVARDQEIGKHTAEVSQIRDKARIQFLESGQSLLTADALAAFREKPEARSDVQKKLIERHAKQLEEVVLKSLVAEDKELISRLEQQIAKLQEATPDLPRAYFMHEPSRVPATTHLLIRGKATRPGIVAPPGFPTVLVARQPDFPGGERTSRRRLALARWIASPDHPLTARVIVNRVWQFHFGEGIVRTPSDFGVMGAPPTHPELLDWLADWFVREGWSLKKLHRLILTSNTYRMSKQWRDDYGASDPENTRWWRFPYRRLEVEAIRDSMLAISGRLNAKMYGPAVYPFIPREALSGNSDPDKVWPAYNPEESSRRTVYAFIKRALVVPLIEVLDLCDTTRSSAKRAVTSVAPQALTLFNGQFVNEQAAHLADRLEQEAGDDDAARITRAYLLAVSRKPLPAERTAMLEFLAAESDKLRHDAETAGSPINPVTTRRRALEQLCRVILNLNELVYPD